MLCLMSPAKALRTNYDFAGKVSMAAMRTSCDSIIARCSQLKKNEIKSLMGLSDSLATLNYYRFQTFEEQEEHPAAYLFDGPAFRSLNIDDFSEDELSRLQESLCILSGCYGILRPLDGIKQYRLEMGSRLNVDGCKNLYEFWAKEHLTEEITKLARENSCHTILNCASQEYSKVVDFDELRNSFNVVDCVFKGPNNGSLASVFGKQARGSMARFVAKKNPQTILDLQEFCEGGMVFSSKYSTPSSLTFERIVETKSKPPTRKRGIVSEKNSLNTKKMKK